MNKFKDRMANETDRQDLMSTIDFIFLQLVKEFNPNIGVDFPYYIKQMLQLRTYHYVTKYQENLNKEIYSDEEFIIEDDSYKELLDRIVNLHSIDDEIELGEKHRQLMIGVLIERKSIKKLAEEEGVPVERLHARLYFLVKKLKGVHETHVEIFGEDMY